MIETQVQAILCDEFFANKIQNGDDFWTRYQGQGYVCPNISEITLNQFSSSNLQWLKVRVLDCEASKAIDDSYGWENSSYAGDTVCADKNDETYDSFVDMSFFKINFVNSYLDLDSYWQSMKPQQYMSHSESVSIKSTIMK